MHRKTNIESLRILLIFFIIIHHILLKIFNLRNIDIMNTMDVLPYTLLNGFLVISVNVFFLISGYFGIKFSFKKIISFIFDIYIIHFITSFTVCVYLNHPFDKEFIKGIIEPITQYWFLMLYIVLLILSPIINMGLNNCDVMVKKKIVIILFFIFSFIGWILPINSFGLNDGYSLIFALYLYMIGNVLREITNINIYKKIFFISLFFQLLTICTCSYLNLGSIIWKMYSYNCPFVVLMAIGFFGIFIRTEIRYNKIINYVSKNVLLIYLIHSNQYFSILYSEIIMKFTNNNIINNLMLVIFSATIIFILSMTLSLIYEWGLKSKFNHCFSSKINCQCSHIKI